MKIELVPGTPVWNVIAHAISLGDNLAFNEDHTIDISMVVGGVEMDMVRFAERIMDAIKCEAYKLFETASLDPIDRVSNVMDDIQMALEDIKERVENVKVFIPYEFEGPYAYRKFPCPECGEDACILYGRAECEACGWSASESDLDEILGEDAEKE